MDILAALDVLQHAPIEVLKHHSRITILTIQRVGQLLEVPLTGDSGITTSSTCRCRRTSSENGIPAPENPSATENDLPSISNNAKNKSPKQNRPGNLWKKIIQSSSLVWRLSDKQPGDIIARKRATQRDKRLDDILRFEKTKTKPTIENQLLRGGAQRSLALQYSRHQVTMKEKSRIDEICCSLWHPQSDQPSSLRSGRGGTLRSWAREYLTFATEDENIVCGAISAGIKQLVIEESLQRKLSQAGSHLKASGISAVTALAIQEFKSLRLEDIPSLIELIAATLTHKETQSSIEGELTSTSSSNVIPSDDEPEFSAGVPWVPTLLEVISKISPWFDRFQCTYDKMIFSDPMLEETLPKRKRVRLTPDYTDCSLSDASESPRLSANSFGYAHSPPTSPQRNIEMSVTSDSSASELPSCENVEQSNDHQHIGSSGRPRNTPEFDNRVSFDATLDSSQAEQGSFLVSSSSNDLTAHHEASVAPSANPHQQDTIVREFQVEEATYHTSQQLDCPECESGTQGSRQSMLLSQIEPATNQSLARGFDRYDFDPFTWIPSQANGSNFEGLQNECVSLQNFARGFDIYEPNPVSWVSGQTFGPESLESLRDRSEPHNLRLARGFDNSNPGAVAWNSGQTSEFGTLQIGDIDL